MRSAQPAQHGCTADRAARAGDLLPRRDSITCPAEGEALLVQDGDGAPPPSPTAPGLGVSYLRVSCRDFPATKM